MLYIAYVKISVLYKIKNRSLRHNKIVLYVNVKYLYEVKNDLYVELLRCLRTLIETSTKMFNYKNHDE